MYESRQKSDSDMPQQQVPERNPAAKGQFHEVKLLKGAMRRHFGPSWLEVSGFGVQPQQANFKCVPTLELLAICDKA